MENTQLLTLILTSSVIGVVVTKLIDVSRDALAGHLNKRRAEVDKAIAERDKARADLADARLELRWWDRWANVLEEALRIMRKRYIDAPCTDPDELDPYPARPDKETP